MLDHYGYRYSGMPKPHVSAFLCLVCPLFVLSSVFAQTAGLSHLLTTPERTSFEETTSYDEVKVFVDVAVSQHPMLHQTTFGYSVEGRALPLVVFGDVRDASPESIKESSLRCKLCGMR